jgi:probable HAF family extracellular repeat protein
LLAVGSVALALLAACETRSTPASSKPETEAPAFEVTDLGPGECYGISTDGRVVGMEAGVGGFVIDASGRRRSLGLFEGDLAIPLGVNSAGDIVGFSQSSQVRRAIVSRAGGDWSKLGFLPGGDWSAALDINDAGDIVGVGVDGASTARAIAAPRGFRITNGTLSDLGTRQGGAAHRLASNGSLAGIFETDAGQTHAMLFANQKLTDLGTLGGPDSAAYGINAQNDVVGVADTASGSSHAFLFRNGAMLDLGTLGGERSDARGIDAGGLAAGNSLDGQGVSHPFLYRGGTLIDLWPKDEQGEPYLTARAEAIASGVIVGSGLRADSTSRCLRWRAKP